MTSNSEIFKLLPPSISDGHLTLPLNPTAFIFPAKTGNSILFSVQGFTLLINGGNEFAPYWSLVRHLNRLDSVLLSNDNDEMVLEGLAKLFKRKQAENGIKLAKEKENAAKEAKEAKDQDIVSIATCNSLPNSTLVNSDSNLSNSNGKDGKDGTDSNLINSTIIGSFLINAIENRALNSILLKKVCKLAKATKIPSQFISSQRIPRSKITPTNVFFNIGVGSIDLYSLSNSNNTGVVIVYKSRGYEECSKNTNTSSSNSNKGSTSSSILDLSNLNGNVRILNPGNLSFNNLKRCLTDVNHVSCLKDYSKVYPYSHTNSASSSSKNSPKDGSSKFGSRGMNHHGSGSGNGYGRTRGTGNPSNQNNRKGLGMAKKSGSLDSNLGNANLHLTNLSMQVQVGDIENSSPETDKENTEPAQPTVKPKIAPKPKPKNPSKNSSKSSLDRLASPKSPREKVVKSDSNRSVGSLKKKKGSKSGSSKNSPTSADEKVSLKEEVKSKDSKPASPVTNSISSNSNTSSNTNSRKHTPRKGSLAASKGPPLCKIGRDGDTFSKSTVIYGDGKSRGNSLIEEGDVKDLHKEEEHQEKEEELVGFLGIYTYSHLMHEKKIKIS